MGDVVDLGAFRRKKEQQIGRGLTPGRNSAPKTKPAKVQKNENLIKNNMEYVTKSSPEPTLNNWIVSTEDATKHLRKVKELLEESLELELGIKRGFDYLEREKAVVASLDAREAAYKYASEHDISIAKDEDGNYTIIGKA